MYSCQLLHLLRHTTMIKPIFKKSKNGLCLIMIFLKTQIQIIKNQNFKSLVSLLNDITYVLIILMLDKLNLLQCYFIFHTIPTCVHTCKCISTNLLLWTFLKKVKNVICSEHLQGTSYMYLYHELQLVCWIIP